MHLESNNDVMSGFWEWGCLLGRAQPDCASSSEGLQSIALDYHRIERNTLSAKSVNRPALEASQASCPVVPIARGLLAQCPNHQRSLPALCVTS